MPGGRTTRTATQGTGTTARSGEPPASTVVEVSAMLPTADILIEVEATAYLPLKP